MNSNESKTTPPVELTDEEMEQASGGTADDTQYSIPVPSDGKIISWSYFACGVAPSFEPFKCQHCNDPSNTYAKRRVEKTLDNLDVESMYKYGKTITYYGYEYCKCFACNELVEYYLIDKC